MRDLKDVGGTSGGIGDFIFGILMMALGGYLLMNQITVHGGYWSMGGWAGQHSFGITLIPVMIGIAMLFYDGRSWLGWILFVGGIVAVLVGVIANLQLYFRPTSLVNTIIIFVLLAGGFGLFLKSLRPRRGAERGLYD